MTIPPPGDAHALSGRMQSTDHPTSRSYPARDSSRLIRRLPALANATPAGESRGNAQSPAFNPGSMADGHAAILVRVCRRVLEMSIRQQIEGGTASKDGPWSDGHQ